MTSRSANAAGVCALQSRSRLTRAHRPVKEKVLARDELTDHVGHDDPVFFTSMKA
jgi:hypothetical protein